MQIAFQQDMFEEKSEIGDLRAEMKIVRESADNVRRGIFARHGELMKLVLKQQVEIQELRDLINGKKNIALTKKSPKKRIAVAEVEQGSFNDLNLEESNPKVNGE